MEVIKSSYFVTISPQGVVMALSACISLSNQTSQFNIDETGTHGTPEFPVAIYRDDVTENFVNWHWHAEI